MKLNQYTIQARILPAILASFPFLVLYFFFLNDHLSGFFKLVFGVSWIGDVSTPVVFLILLSFIGRSIGKDLYESTWFSRDETRMPTTDFLMHSNSEYTLQFKQKIHDKIKVDYNIHIFIPDEELRNETEARKTIAEAVTLIRHSLKDGRLLLSRTIEYGFIRNLIGCSVISVFVSIVNMFVFSLVKDIHAAYYLSLTMALAYLFLMLLNKKLIHNHGKRYARSLFQEYVSK